MPDIDFCIKYLKDYDQVNLPVTLSKQDTLRALMNVTMPEDLSIEYYKAQDRVLQEYYSTKDIVDVAKLPEIDEKISLYKGDITLLKADAIVNACNEQLLGCFVPLHKCIDNAIHSFAGLEVRRDLIKVMREQGHEEANGQCKVTPGYNLPAKYIFHTVGPKAFGMVTPENEKDLTNCYVSCMKKAEEMGLKNIVFCSLSTGVFGYPIEKASKVAVETVRNILKRGTTVEKVIFNVFSERDYDVYDRTIKENY